MSTEQPERESDRSSHRLELRKKNIEANSTRPDLSSMGNLDGSIKKNTAFVKKLKTSLTSEQLPSLTKELLSLKLEKYLTEVVVSIGEAKFKNSADVWAAVEICSHLHQRFADFAPNIKENLSKQLGPPPAASAMSAEQKEKEDAARVSKQRSVLRLFGELYLVGIIPEAPKENVMAHVIKDLFSTDRDFSNLPLAVAFVKFMGTEFIDKSTAEPEKEKPAPENVRKSIKMMLSEYYKHLSRKVVQEHKRVRQMEHANHEHLMTHGKLSDARQELYDKNFKYFEKIRTGAQSLADALELEMPELEEDKNVTRISSIGISQGSREKEEQDVSSSLWEDDDVRSFYEDLADIKSFVPAIFLTDKKSEKKDGDKKEDEKADDNEEDEPSTLADPLPEENDANNEDGIKNTTNSAALDAIIARLSHALNREAIDQIAIDFCFLNSKGTRKKFCKALQAVPRTRSDLLPYYSRLIATLDQSLPDIGPTMVDWLEREFHYHQKKKEQVLIEEKLKNIKFIGELTKFNIMPLPKIFHTLHMMLEDFSHHNIELTCALLETCGRYLFKRPETNVRTSNLLDVMMRKKNVQHVDPRQALMIENAFYQCNPPDKSAIMQKQRPPLELYLRKLIYGDLAKKTVEKILKQIRKMNWEDPATRAMITKVFFKIWKVKFSNLHLMAFLASELSRYYPEFGIAVVDNTLEHIRLGLEFNIFKHNQRRIAVVKFLAELYNYRMVESAVIFDTMYLILRFGHESGIPRPGAFNSFDAPHDFFRVRLVCTILDTCGQCFDRGSTGKKLDVFLVFFQMYARTKIHLPMDVEFLLTETFELLRPNLIIYPTYEEAAAEVNKIAMAQQAKLQSQAGAGAGATANEAVENSDDDEEEDEDGGKGRFDEDDESEVGEGEEDGEARAPETEEDEGEDEEEEEDIIVHVAEPRVDEQEALEFEREFNMMMQESLDSRKNERKLAALDVPIPVRGKPSFSGGDELEETNDGHVAFMLLTKKGNKQQTKMMALPADNALVISARSKQEAEHEEKLQLKQIVLNFEERERDALRRANEPVPPAPVGRGGGRRGSAGNRRVLWTSNSGGGAAYYNNDRRR
ncbi:armadillo-type protein [Cladochytrium replicatum]|nr:armadillo-type protein [Cladochytrium replicatum]